MPLLSLLVRGANRKPISKNEESLRKNPCWCECASIGYKLTLANRVGRRAVALYYDLAEAEEQAIGFVAFRKK